MYMLPPSLPVPLSLTPPLPQARERQAALGSDSPVLGGRTGGEKKR